MILFFLTFLLRIWLQVVTGTRARYWCWIQDGQSHEVWNRHLCLQDVVFPGCSQLPHAIGAGTYGQPCAVTLVFSTRWSFFSTGGLHVSPQMLCCFISMLKEVVFVENDEFLGPEESMDSIRRQKVR